MATTRNERRRRWFLRSWATAGWLKWQAALRGERQEHWLTPVQTTPHSQQWTRFAADVRVPGGVWLEVRQQRTAVSIRVPLSDPYLLIGNHPACGLRLDGLPSREIQYALFWLNGELHAIDLRQNSAQPPAGPRREGWWSDQNHLRLGDYHLQVRGLPGWPSRTFPFDDHSTVTLHLDSPDGRQERPLTRWITLVGSAADNGIVLREPGIASRQAALIRTPVSLWIVNLADAAPPRINSRNSPWSLLDPHDEFVMGNTHCQVMTEWPEPALSEFHETTPAVPPSTMLQLESAEMQNG